MEENNKINPDLVVTLFLLCLIAILISFNNFYINKNFDFIVETSCNPEVETCYFRNCQAEDAECPPNNLSYYKVYSLNAKDFKKCENEDCAVFCSINSDLCEETVCSEEDGEECISPNVLEN